MHPPAYLGITPSGFRGVPPLQATQLQGRLPGLHASLTGQQGTVSSMQGQLASVPDVTPYLASLDSIADVYDELPQPPSKLTTDVQKGVESIVAEVQQVSL